MAVNPDRPPTPISRLLALAAWIGLAYGIFEGLESFLLSLLPQGLSWQNGNSVDALMYMPVFYLIAYLLFALLLVPLVLLFRRFDWDIVLVFGLVALSGFLAARNQGAVFSLWASALLGLGFGTVAMRVYRKHLDRWRHGVVRSLPMLAVVVVVVIGGTFLGKRFVEQRKLAALPSPDRPRLNVLLIILDTQRADHLSAYGYHRPTSPRLDSFASGGALFEQAYAASSWTLPSHASLFTGRMVHEHDAGAGGKRVLGTEYPTLAERFSEEGYATGGFVSNIFWAGRHTGLARGFVHYEDYYGTVPDAFRRMTLLRDVPWIRGWLGAVDLKGRKRASHINADFLGWVERLEGRPFFAFLNYMDVHIPYLPPAPHEGRFGPIRPELRPRKLEMGKEAKEKLTPEQIAYRVDRYDESILYLDEQIGRLLDALEERRILDKTVVVITSDHGEHLGEHGIVEHGKSLYAMETRVPLILHYPGVSPVRVTSPVSAINVAATIGSLAGLPAGSFPGRSLAQREDSAGVEAIPVLSEMGGTGGLNAPAGKGWLKSLVSGQWHYIVRQNGKVELFDISRDTTETTNLATTPLGGEAVRRLQVELERIIAPDSPPVSRRIAAQPGRPALR